ncbi:hypothetical protein RQP46_010267 [Phenoliferia psychrophenolica]
MGSRRSTFVHAALATVVLASLLSSASAHEHHDEDVGPYEQNFMNEEEIDSVLKWHIGLQVASWGVLFPVGMVLGITKSRLHAPWQGITCVLSWTGSWLAHHHSGRSFHSTAHSHFASYLKWYLILQVALGVFLKLHVMEGTLVRRIAKTTHGVIGKSFPVVGWAQMIFGGIAALGFCFGEHVGQCIAHFAMGTAFIAYAMIMLLMMRVGAGFLMRRKVSQEYLDSWVIMVWGVINTFTMHDFFRASNGWSHKDMQHVSLGVLWWAGGALGIFLARNGKRNIVPAIIISMTGFAMSAHAQSLEFSTNVHKLFGFALMSAGVARVIEVCFVLSDAPSPPSNPRAFQHLPPFLLVLSGLTFLSATEEQMQWIAGSGMDSTTTWKLASDELTSSLAFHLVQLYLVPSKSFEIGSGRLDDPPEIRFGGIRSRDSLFEEFMSKGARMSCHSAIVGGALIAPYRRYQEGPPEESNIESGMIRQPLRDQIEKRLVDVAAQISVAGKNVSVAEAMEGLYVVSDLKWKLVKLCG